MVGVALVGLVASIAMPLGFDVVTAAPASAATTAPHQMWVYTYSAPPDVLVSNAQEYGVTDLLVWVSPGFTSNATTMSYLHTLATDASAVGISLEALCGDNSWLTHPGVVASWSASVAGTGLFSGIHLDIEPGSLPAWNTNRTLLENELLTDLSRARTSGGGLPITEDIPYWFNTDTAPGGGPFDEAVMRATDAVTIMAYRNTTSGVLSVATAEMNDATTLGTKAWIGIDTANDPPLSQTFYGITSADLLTALGVIDTSASSSWPAAYAGLAIEDAESLPTS